MQELLYKGSKEGAVLVNTVITRARKGTKDVANIAKALREYYIEEKSLTPKDKPDINTDNSSNESDTRQGHTSLEQPKKPQSRQITPITPEKKARALKECYYNLIAGHFSARKTQEKLSRRYI
jgi:hypothetical protein